MKSYDIGELTMDRVFRANDIENVSNMQMVFDAIERAFEAYERQPAPVAEVIIRGLVMVHGRPMSIDEIERRMT